MRGFHGRDYIRELDGGSEHGGQLVKNPDYTKNPNPDSSRLTSDSRLITYSLFTVTQTS
jgi:hypothetical protein